MIAVSKYWLVQGVSTTFVVMKGYLVTKDFQRMIKMQAACLNTRDNIRFVEMRLIGRI